MDKSASRAIILEGLLKARENIAGVKAYAKFCDQKETAFNHDLVVCLENLLKDIVGLEYDIRAGNIPVYEED